MTPFKNYSVEKKNRKPEKRKLFSYVLNISENNIDTCIDTISTGQKHILTFLVHMEVATGNLFKRRGHEFVCQCSLWIPPYRYLHKTLSER